LPSEAHFYCHQQTVDQFLDLVSFAIAESSLDLMLIPLGFFGVKEMLWLPVCQLVQRLFVFDGCSACLVRLAVPLL
jgi:hypothetical protein